MAIESAALGGSRVEVTSDASLTVNNASPGSAGGCVTTRSHHIWVALILNILASRLA